MLAVAMTACMWTLAVAMTVLAHGVLPAHLLSPCTTHLPATASHTARTCPTQEEQLAQVSAVASADHRCGGGGEGGACMGVPEGGAVV